MCERENGAGMTNIFSSKHWVCSSLWLALLIAVLQSVLAEEQPAPATPEKVKQWLTELNSDEYITRETAQKNLRAACTQGENSKPALELINAALAASDDPEIKTRLKKVLSGLERESKIDTALRDLNASDTAVLLAALDVLWEHSQNPRVNQKLEELKTSAVTPLKEVATVFLKHLVKNKSYQDELDKYKRRSSRNEEVMKVVQQQISVLSGKQKMEMQREVKEVLDKAQPPAAK